jgi:hypothetical protein
LTRQLDFTIRGVAQWAPVQDDEAQFERAGRMINRAVDAGERLLVSLLWKMNPRSNEPSTHGRIRAQSSPIA